MKLFGAPDVEKLKAKSDVKGLIKASAAKDENVRQSSVSALADLLRQASLRERQAMLDTIGDEARKLTADQLFDVLYPVFYSADPGPRLDAATSALLVHRSGAVGALLRAANDETRANTAVRALGLLRLQDDRAIDYLVERARERESSDREMAVVALYRIGGAKARKALDPYFQTSGTWPDEAVDDLVRLLQSAPSDQEEIRTIGEKLNRLGGFGLMVEVHARVADRLPGAARTLEVMWDNVGMWMS